MTLKSVRFKDAYKHWSKVVAILNQAFTQGDVKEEHFASAASSRRAAEVELTAIENARLKTSTRAYQALSTTIVHKKRDLEDVRSNAEHFIRAAGQADQLVQILAKLVPLI